MAIVTGTFPDYERHKNEGFFRLTCDKTMNPFTWQPPINWTGFINNIAVKFVQTEASGYHRDDFDFSSFPEELKPAIDYIVEAIDNAMKTMD